MSDQEEQCEDALFAVCDYRERLPLSCATELKRSIELINNIHMAKVLIEPVKTLDMPSCINEECATLEKDLSALTGSLKTQDNKLEMMINKTRNLKATMKQIKKDNSCELNKLLRN